MIQELEQELKLFQQEMSKLSTAVEHIASAKEAAVKAVESVGDLGKTLDGYAHSIKEQQDSYSVRLESPIETYQTLAETASVLSERLTSVDFPSRLDKIESVVRDTIDELRAGRERLKLEADRLQDKSDAHILELKKMLTRLEEKHQEHLGEYNKSFTAFQSEVSAQLESHELARKEQFNGLKKVLIVLSIGIVVGLVFSILAYFA